MKKWMGRLTWQKITRILIILVVAVLLLVLSLAVAINIPAFQTFVAGKIISGIREKSGTGLTLQSVKIAFPNTVRIGEIYIQDKNSDTLLSLKSLKANIGLWKLLQNKVLVSSLELDDAVVHLARREKEAGFNYQFLLDQFSGKEKKQASSEKTEKAWMINVSEIGLNKFHFTFNDHQQGIQTDIFLDKFHVSVNELDLSKHLLEIGKVILKGGRVGIARETPGSVTSEVVSGNRTAADKSLRMADSANVSFFPDWNISAEKIEVENTAIRYDNKDADIKEAGIDYNHLSVVNLNGNLEDIRFSRDGISAVIESLSLEENNGFSLKKLAAAVQYSQNITEVQNLLLNTPLSDIAGNVKIEYDGIGQLVKDFINCTLSLDIKKIKLNTADLLPFAPELATNSLFREAGSSLLLTNTVISGKVNDLNIENLELSLLQHTLLKAHGMLKGLPDYKKAGFDLTVEQLSSCKEDLFKFITPSLFAGYNLPETFSLAGTAAGNTGLFSASTSLTTSLGDLSANCWYNEYGTALEDSFKIDFDAREINAGKMAGDTLLGKISVSGVASGKGIIHGALACSAGLHIREADYHSYKYSDIQINSSICNKKITASATSGDPNLKFRFAAVADLSEHGKKLSATMDLAMLNLKALNFTPKDLSLRTNLTTKLEYRDANSFKAEAEFRNAVLTDGDKSFPVNILRATAEYAPEDFKVQVKGDMADCVLSSNIRPEKLPGLLESAYRKYFGLPVTQESVEGRTVSFRADFFRQQNIIQHLIPGLEILKIGKMEGSYDSKNNELTAEIEIPNAGYLRFAIDTLMIAVKGKNDSIVLDATLKKINYDGLRTSNLSIREQVKGGKIHSLIKVADSSGAPLYLFDNQINFLENGYTLKFLPGGLILDGSAWDTPVDNFLQKKNGAITTIHFNFKKKKESIEFLSDENSRKFVFKNFEIKNLLNVVDYKGKKNIVSGLVDGETSISGSAEVPIVNASFEINNLAFQDSVIGNLSCNLRTQNDQVDIDTKIYNHLNKIELLGKIDHLSKSPSMDLNATISLDNLSKLEKFSFGKLSKVSGKFYGEATIKGAIEKPEIEGYMKFEETIFKINELNLLAKLTNEKITISDKGFHFKNFIVKDSQSRNLTINGDLLTDFKKDFKYNLHIQTRDFQPVNSTSADNPLFFGKLGLDTDLKLSGSLKSPKIETDVKINGSTDLTYALPGSELKLVTSEGIVNFRDSSHINDSLMSEKQVNYLADSIISKFKGMDLSMNLEIDPDAKFRVDIDPKSGDYLAISGSSKLNISLDVSGKQSITGVYEVKSGNYQLSFYGMVKKNFTILPGSTVTWSGRPMDADVNITAEYVVRTSSVALVANETSGMSETEKNVFKTRLPYEVKLIIRGFLTKPEIRFGLDLPDKYLMTYPVVASKVAILNTEEKASELNKQVFALLVTGGFIADNPMASTEGSSPTSIASTAARNSVNGILADQMNNLSGKYINRVDVNFGLTSYEDYGQGTSDTRTELDVQLSKKMFNDRLTVEAQGSFDLSGDKKNTGTSTEKSNGEVGVVYQLTKNNEYKLRLYYQNIYDLFEGELTCSGIALIFEKEFDTLKKPKNQTVSKNKIKQ